MNIESEAPSAIEMGALMLSLYNNYPVVSGEMAVAAAINVSMVLHVAMEHLWQNYRPTIGKMLAAFPHSGFMT